MLQYCYASYGSWRQNQNARDILREASIIQIHPRNGNTLRHVHIILSANAGGYIFIQNTRNERLPAWIWSGSQETQLNCLKVGKTGQFHS